MMRKFLPKPIVLRLFRRLREDKFQLGVNEYLAALDAIDGGFGANDQEDLRQMLCMLWCHSPDEQNRFDSIFKTIDKESKPIEVMDRPDRPVERPETHSPSSTSNSLPSADKVEPLLPEKTSEPEFSTLPWRSPFQPVDGEDLPELYTYHPLSRRSMSYGWRFLSRSVADGVEDVLDVSATVEKTAKQGFFLAPVYRRRMVNRAKVLLLVDQGGSMTPLHRFTRDFVETAQMPGVFPEEGVQVGYFHNFPTEYMYRDERLTLPCETVGLLAECDAETSVLIVSDAGASRGYRRMERIRKTTDFLVKLKRQSNLICWLNPMPIERWQGSSAEVIAYLVQMEQMNADGLGNAIDLVTGRSVDGGGQRIA
jgi:uncharacterized protein